MNGYYGVGVIGVKYSQNIGTLWRSANIFGASFIFTIGARYKHQHSDTPKTPNSIPLLFFTTFEDFKNSIDSNCEIVAIEMGNDSVPIKAAAHAKKCVYLLGAEDYGIPIDVLQNCKDIVQLPGKFSMNVAVAGSIVMYDKYIKHETLKQSSSNG